MALDKKSAQSAFDRFAAVAQQVHALPPRAAVAREAGAARRDEIVASSRLAGSSLDASEVAVLLDRGRAVGGHPLADYLLVRNYAAAAGWASSQPLRHPGDRRPLFTVDEIRRLHAMAANGEADAHPGAWRMTNPGASAAGTVHPPPWLIPREMDVLVDRFARGPGEETLPLWASRLIGRYLRIRPFSAANGRSARLVLVLAFARSGLPAPAFGGVSGRRYGSAVASAVAGDPLPLAVLIARAGSAAGERLVAAGGTDAGPLIPLSEAPSGAALYKAAQRSRLRTVTRGGRVFTTQAWIDSYRASRSRAGRRPR